MNWETEQLMSAAEKLDMDYMELVKFLGKMKRLSPQEISVIQNNLSAALTSQFKKAGNV